MGTIEINKRTKASMAFLEYCRTLPFAKVKIDNENPSPSVGQMNFYLNYFRKEANTETDNEPK